MTRFLNRFFRAVSLVVTDRRWAAPLSAMALGFGLFIGVAIGPSAAGTLAGVAPIVELRAPSVERGAGDDDGGGAGIAASPAGSSIAASGGGEGGLGALPAPAPLEPAAVEPAPAAKEPRSPSRRPAEEPEEEETQVFKGVVVQANPAAGSYAMAIEGGELVSVHAAELPAPGTKLSPTVRRLVNNTFAEVKAGKAQGDAVRATFRGVVTFVDADPANPAYTVSGRGASILVRVRPDAAGAAPQRPALGSYATVTVDIEANSTAAPGTAVGPPPLACAPDLSLPALKPLAPAALLWQGEIEVEGEPSTYVDLAGIVSALCPARLVISADGTRESERDLELTVPAALETSGLRIGNSIVATAEIGEGGALTLAGLASDEHLKGANDPSSTQGDLKQR